MYNKNNSNDWRLRIRKHGCQKEINILKVLNEKNDQPRILHPVKISFRNDSEKKTFSEEKNWQTVSNSSQLSVLPVMPCAIDLLPENGQVLLPTEYGKGNGCHFCDYVT